MFILFVSLLKYIHTTIIINKKFKYFRKFTLRKTYFKENASEGLVLLLLFFQIALPWI